MATIQIKNLKNLGFEDNDINNPEVIAAGVIGLWENSGKGRTAAIVVCESEDGLYHLHGAFYSAGPTTLRNVANILGKSHTEPQLGGKQQLEDYLLKAPPYDEKGEKILYALGIENIQDKQGERTDIARIESMLNDGMTPSQIYASGFQFRRYENMIRSAYIERRIREAPFIKQMWNEYHFGLSGSGKSFTYVRLSKELGEDNVYLCTDYASGGLDYYMDTCAHCLFLDEFRGDEGMSYYQLLTVLGRFSHAQIRSRYRNTFCLWDSTILCSIYSPEELYNNMVPEEKRKRDTITQLMRRLSVIVYHTRDREGHYRTYTLPASKYVNALQIKNLALKYESDVSYDDFLKSYDKNRKKH